MKERVKNLRACNVCKNIKLIGHTGFTGICEKTGKELNYLNYSGAERCDYFKSDFKSACNSCINYECKTPNSGMGVCSKQIRINQEQLTYTDLLIQGIL